MDGEKRALWRQLSVDLVMAVRAEYLAAGASPLKHWDQIRDRMRAAASTSATTSEWVTSLLRGLALGAPSSATSSAADALVVAVEEEGADDEFLSFVEAEHGLILARARLEGERRRSTKRNDTVTAAEPGLFTEEK